MVCVLTLKELLVLKGTSVLVLVFYLKEAFLPKTVISLYPGNSKLCPLLLSAPWYPQSTCNSVYYYISFVFFGKAVDLVFKNTLATRRYHEKKYPRLLTIATQLLLLAIAIRQSAVAECPLSTHKH